MGRLWVVGDRVRLDAPIIGVVVDVHSGGHTVVEPDETIDRVCADEDLWAPAEHAPGCLGEHFGDCAVSGLFDAPKRRTPTTAEQAAYLRGREEVRSQLLALEGQLTMKEAELSSLREELRHVRGLLTSQLPSDEVET